MFKQLLMIIILISEATLFTCNLCIEHKGRLLHRKTTQKAQCNCNCWKHPKSKHHHRYRCLKCGHRLLPETLHHSNIKIPAETNLSEWKKFRKFKRYHQVAPRGYNKNQTLVALADHTTE